MKSLYRICARHSLLPSSLQVEVSYDPAALAHSRGGFADVWKGKYGSLEVAVKVLRTDAKSDLRQIARVSCNDVSCPGAFANALGETCAGVLQGVRDVEGS